jgi:predicted glycogen debranching enzyme
MIEKCFDEAKKVLKENATKQGIMAGREWYRDVWGRDALVSSLGMSASDDEELVKLAETTINSVSKFQKANGQLPNKFDAFGKKLCFGEGGCVDTSLWYPIAVFNHYRNTGNKKFLRTHMPKVEKALFWAGCLDQNNDLLLETHEGADWMDLLLRSGRVLYDQALYYKALQAADEMQGVLGIKREFTTLAKDLRRNINIFFWPQHQNHNFVKEQFGHTGIEKDFECVLYHGEKDHYYAEVGFRKFDPRFDVYANLLAVIFDVADSDKSARIMRQVREQNIAHPYPVKVLNPPIGDKDFFRPFYFRWTELPHLQQPGNYHNGGIWPFVGGFYVMALKKTEGDWSAALNKLAEANKAGKANDWEFNEWLNADGVPMGSAYQSWSAAMFILAYEYVKKKSKLWWLSPF